MNKQATMTRIGYVLSTYLFAAVSPILCFAQSDQQHQRSIDRTRQQIESERNLIKIGNIDLSFFKLSNEDKQLIAPSDSVKAEYAEILRLPDTELVKLLNASCSQVGMVDLSDACKGTIPGFGAFYSFRNRRHLEPSMADLRLTNDWFVSSGYSTQGIIVSLGAADLKTISLSDPGVRFLYQFSPAEFAVDADEQRKQIENGIEKNGYRYNRALRVKVNDVYAMRSIAYNTRAKTLDSRKDVIVAFKVISRDDNGNVVLIWRKLQEKPAPKLKPRK